MTKQEFLEGVMDAAKNGSIFADENELREAYQTITEVREFDPILANKLTMLVDGMVDLHAYCKSKIETK